MKNVTTALLMSIALGSSVMQSAQRTSDPGAAQPGQQAAPLTVIGCLQRTNTGVPPAAASVDAGQTSGGAFVLANARPSVGTAVTSGGADVTGTAGRSGASGGTAAAPPSTSSSGSSSPAGRGSSATAAATTTSGDQGAATGTLTYTLVETKQGELATHVGHQIQVTGRLASSAGSAATTDGAAGSTSPRMEVTSVMMMSPTCPSAQAPAGAATTPSPAR
jgi:hypothetical protein